MKTRFRQFLQESSAEIYKDLTFNDALDIAREHCGQAFKLFEEGQYIYRGVPNRISDDEILLVDPHASVHGRRSANTTNFYNLIFSYDPLWVSYPKRDRATICTTDPSYAQGYGRIALVLPYDYANIGVCPELDIWHSFPKLNRLYSFGQLSEINHMIDLILTACGKVGGFTNAGADQSWTSFQGVCTKAEKIIREKGNDVIAWMKAHYGRLEFTKDLMDAVDNGQSIPEFLGDMLNPDMHDFRHTRIAEFKRDKESQEIWTDAKALLIPHKLIDQFAKKL